MHILLSDREERSCMSLRMKRLNARKTSYGLYRWGSTGWSYGHRISTKRSMIQVSQQMHVCAGCVDGNFKQEIMFSRTTFSSCEKIKSHTKTITHIKNITHSTKKNYK